MNFNEEGGVVGRLGPLGSWKMTVCNPVVTSKLAISVAKALAAAGREADAVATPLGSRNQDGRMLARVNAEEAAKQQQNECR